MIYAIIEDNKIVNIAVADTYLDINWVQLQDGFSIGDTYVNGVFSKAEVVIPVPQTITKLQAMKQLKVIGKWDAVKLTLSQNEDMNDEWILSNELNRTYPFVLDMATLLEFSETELDQFFIEASKL